MFLQPFNCFTTLQRVLVITYNTTYKGLSLTTYTTYIHHLSNGQRHFFFNVIYSIRIWPNRNTLPWTYMTRSSKGKLLLLYVLTETHLCPARLNTGCPFYLSRVTVLWPLVLRKAVELFSGN